MTHFGSTYSTPGWQRAQKRGKGGGFGGSDREFEEESQDYDYEPEGSFSSNSPQGGGRGSATSSSHKGANASATSSPPPLRGRDRERGNFGGHGAGNSRRDAARRRGPLTIEGELVAKSTGAVSAFAIGDRVFHQKFGNGNVTNVDGNKLTIAFDKAGEKRVVDSFVERV
jgi:DNA helicase-2/ATP-dependent DNA helicase PcrA